MPIIRLCAFEGAKGRAQLGQLLALQPGDMGTSSDQLLATANAVTELLSAGIENCSKGLESRLASLGEGAQGPGLSGSCWQALALLWPQYTRTATDVVQSRSKTASDGTWWSVHHAVHDLAQQCEQTEEVNLILCQMGLYAAQVCR